MTQLRFGRAVQELEDRIAVIFGIIDEDGSGSIDYPEMRAGCASVMMISVPALCICSGVSPHR